MITVTIDARELETVEDDVSTWPYRKSHLEEVDREISFTLSPRAPNLNLCSHSHVNFFDDYGTEGLIEVEVPGHVFRVEKKELRKLSILWES